MKKILTLILSAVISILCMTACSAEENFTLTMQVGSPIMTADGVQKEIDPGRGTTPVVVGDRTLVPIRAAIEEMGGAVHWEEDIKQLQTG